MVDNLNPVACPEDRIVHEETNTEAYIKDECIGSGTLYLSENSLVWSRADNKGLHLSYPSIMVHAVSRDTSSFPHECLFLMIDQELVHGRQEPMDEDADSDADSQGAVGEVRFVPACKTNLDAMYQAMCACQQLHPDEEDQSSDEFYESAEAAGDSADFGVPLSAQGMANLARMEQMLAVSNGNGYHADMEQGEADDEGQFEDIE